MSYEERLVRAAEAHRERMERKRAQYLERQAQVKPPVDRTAAAHRKRMEKKKQRYLKVLEKIPERLRTIEALQIDIAQCDQLMRRYAKQTTKAAWHEVKQLDKAIKLRKQWLMFLSETTSHPSETPAP